MELSHKKTKAFHEHNFLFCFQVTEEMMEESSAKRSEALSAMSEGKI